MDGVWGGGSSANYSNFIDICQFLFKTYGCPAFIRYALTFKHIGTRILERP